MVMLVDGMMTKMTAIKQHKSSDLEGIKRYWWRETAVAPTCNTALPKPGEPCPHCGKGILAYDSLFLLTCSTCGKVAEGGAFT